ncbi:hypothetical protein GCM10007916_12890 [Psychromonas marina]|uniref:DUF624 domain-containing protein n=1 Tax=Psychromonas marina TaxID=88364 RepID=A0ABQ6DYQ7_9GAMM|nr:hypothetical protein [Psychromonas marina]GLS90222.1 hypothetical protein GCM10007916_12890 [Psychromonas marina]
MNKTHFVLGGDLKKSLTDGYTLDFKLLFKDAFSITRTHFIPLVIACLITVAIVGSLYSLSHTVLADLNQSSREIVNFIFSSFILTPLITGLQMMGIHHSIGLKTRSTDLFNFFNMLLKLALASLILNIISYIMIVILNAVLGDNAFLPLVLVVLYFNMAFCMVYPLIAEKKITPQLAIKLSFKLVNKNLFQFTLLFILLALLAIIAALPSGIGLFFFIPFYFNLMGIVYRQTCGVGVVATEVDDKNNDDSDNDDSSNNGSTEQNGSKNSSEFEA